MITKFFDKTIILRLRKTKVAKKEFYDAKKPDLIDWFDYKSEMFIV